MDRQKFIDTINGMKNGEYYTHEGRNGVFYNFHKYAGSCYEVWISVKGYHVANIHFDRFTSSVGSIIGLAQGDEYAGCIPVYELGVE